MQKPLNPVLPLKHVLPYPINTVLIEDFVLSNNGHRFDMRLGDEHAVAVNKKKARLDIPAGPLEFS